VPISLPTLTDGLSPPDLEPAFSSEYESLIRILVEETTYDFPPQFYQLPEPLQPYQVNPVRRREAPTQGYWPRDAIVWRQSLGGATSMDEEEPVGWVCVEAGRPGRWRSFGAGPASVSVVSELERAAELWERGVLTAEEFSALKRSLLKSDDEAVTSTTERSEALPRSPTHVGKETQPG
jgi:hypothetical protein